jgi:hypothetical protein
MKTNTGLAFESLKKVGVILFMATRQEPRPNDKQECFEHLAKAKGALPDNSEAQSRLERITEELHHFPHLLSGQFQGKEKHHIGKILGRLIWLMGYVKNKCDSN